LINSEEKGLLHLLSDSLKKTVIDNDDIKSQMFNNIVLAGGTSMMSGFSQRLSRSLPSYLDQGDSNSINIVADNLRYLSTWIGGSMISSMSTFSKLLITREIWMESGEDKIGIFKKIF
jgi:actin-related protein